MSEREALRPRVVTLVLCRPDGTVLGALPPFEVAVPWWQEVAPVVTAAWERHGLRATVLRLLDAVPDARSAGGPVTYLAEVDDGPLPELTPWPGDLDEEEPLRAPWARPGGPAADLAWADAALHERRTPRVAAAQQVRTWNLSSLWRLPTADGAAWLKVVPPFFAHEGSVLAALPVGLVPPMLAHDGPKVLLAEVPGDDQYDATGAPLSEMVRLLVDLQASWIQRADELLALGAPDWRAEPLATQLAQLVDAAAPTLDLPVAATLEALVDGLWDRFAQVSTCGLPDTLVHGDFHRGNVRGDPGRFVLLDWGDCGLGHPMLDQAAFLDPLPAADQDPVRTTWAGAWKAAIPGSDPERAAALLAPVAALRQALVHRRFLDAIEPSERIYHRDDPAAWLTRAAHLARATSTRRAGG
ncbi:MAG: aminoglycoside phosphotransferase family protein [Acidimicrobiales bacterium]